MHIYLMVLLISCSTSVCNILLKKFQKETKDTFLTICTLNIVNALTACIFFLTVNKFKININIPTLIFSIVAIFIVSGNIILNLFALKISSLAFVSIIITSGSLIGTAMFGRLFLNEVINTLLILAIILTVTAVSLPFITDRIKNKHNSKVSLYTMLTTSIALILNTLASRYIFKEKMPFENKIAVLLTVLSICLAV